MFKVESDYPICQFVRLIQKRILQMRFVYNIREKLLNEGHRYLFIDGLHEKLVISSRTEKRIIRYLNLKRLCDFNHIYRYSLFFKSSTKIEILTKYILQGPITEVKCIRLITISFRCSCLI